ncbi:MAG: DUF349 domain-containing protein [Bacteroidales bacterium]|nr:DUF349 domain-containing protein [Bacteroidales bacterium]
MNESFVPEETAKVVSDVAENAVVNAAEAGTAAPEPVVEAAVPEPVVVEAAAAEPVAEEPVAETAAESEEAEPAAGLEPVASEPSAEPAAEPAESEPKKELNLADKTLAELSALFQELRDSVNGMQRYKEAEAIKSAFYKLLGRLKGENPAEENSLSNPFEAVEENFKAIYADYKKARAEYNREQDARREENLAEKKAIIEELKALVADGGETGHSFEAFRKLQDRWRQAGPVPVTAFRDLNDSYQYQVEKFYDMVKISRELRDLDFQKNLEAKEKLCEAASALAENENVVSAFHELQKLHEQWKELGPVAKEFRESIWERFREATAVINKRYQAHFEGLKDEQLANLEAKRALCEEVEEIAVKEISSSSEWNEFSQKIEEIQARWKAVGFATRKENQKVYERVRAACDKFFERKREYYNSFKDSMNENLEKKMAIIAKAEELKTSTDWKKTADQLIDLQRQWKEIGAVPRKKSEQIWKRFRAACDEFFAERDKHAKPENDFHANLRAKRQIIDEVKAYEPSDEAANAAAQRGYNERWQAIGHVPFKEKDAVNAAYRDAVREKFPRSQSPRGGQERKAPRSGRDLLMDKYRKLQQDIVTFENNIGFFSASKNAESLVKQLQGRIDQAKEELKALEQQIRSASAEENE